MNLQKGIIKDKDGNEQVVICDVTDPDKSQLLLALFNSWNNQFVADHIIRCISKYEKDHSK